MIFFPHFFCSELYDLKIGYKQHKPEMFLSLFISILQNVVIDQVLGPRIRVTVVMGTDRNWSSGMTSAFIVAICDLVCFILSLLSLNWKSSM